MPNRYSFPLLSIGNNRKSHYLDSVHFGRILIMKWLIKLAQLGKRVFIKARLHVLIEPFNPFLLRLSFLSRLSQWISTQKALPFADVHDPQIRYDKRYELYKFLLESERLDEQIDFLEFGVGAGHSFKWWVEHNRHPASKFFGFDTFTGLPERFGLLKEGTFSTGGKIPEIADARCAFCPGLFQQTLGPFVQSHPLQHRKVIHLDADLYSSTLFVLTRLAPCLRKDDILLFDEFGVPTDEFRAFADFVSAYAIKYEVLGAVNNYLHVAIKLL